MATISREITAISRSKPSAPTKWAFENGYLTPHIYDWGCGRGADARWLDEQGHIVTAYDPYWSPSYSPDEMVFDQIGTIICNYVLNVIETEKERQDLLKSIASKGVGTVVVSVRSDVQKQAEKKGWKKHKDGYLVPKNGKFTFQKNYTVDEVKDMEKILGPIVAMKKLSGGIVAVFEK